MLRQPKTQKPHDPTDLVRDWPLPPAATLGSTVRAKGIGQEVRAQLPWAVKKAVDVAAGTLTLRLAADARAEFDATATKITRVLADIESLPILPREIEDILAISTSERHRWLKDGRLPSLGTRTVKLMGRAKQITFHVFDPRVVEDILDRDLVDGWREDDALAAAEKRRQAAWKRKLRRAETEAPATLTGKTGEPRPQLVGWAEFERDGPL